MRSRCCIFCGVITHVNTFFTVIADTISLRWDEGGNATVLYITVISRTLMQIQNDRGLCIQSFICLFDKIHIRDYKNNQHRFLFLPYEDKTYGII